MIVTLTAGVSITVSTMRMLVWSATPVSDFNNNHYRGEDNIFDIGGLTFFNTYK